MNYREQFSEVLYKLRKENCAFLTIPSVAFEFQRTDSIEGLNKRTDFLNTYTKIYQIERHIHEFDEVITVLQKIKGKISYSDFLLYCCLYKFAGSMLLTENHKDFTTNILDRVTIFTIDNEGPNLRTTGLYCLNKTKYEKVVTSILSNNV